MNVIRENNDEAKFELEINGEIVLTFYSCSKVEDLLQEIYKNFSHILKDPLTKYKLFKTIKSKL